MFRRIHSVTRFGRLRSEYIFNGFEFKAVLVKDQKCQFSMQMNEDAQLFNQANKLTRQHASMFLREYAPTFRWKDNNVKILDVGCGDGSVTQILKKYIPENYEALIGCDMSEQMVKFANDYYSSDRTRFFKLDIEGDIPRELKDSFDYIFSFYVFNWVRNQEKAFKNIYKFLKKGGGCFITFPAYTPIYLIFITLAKSKKWAPYLKDINNMVSPYYDTQSPDVKIAKMLKNIGFQQIDVRCKQTIYIYESPEELKDLILAVNPFKFPEDSMYKEFIEDFVQLSREIRLYDETNNTFKVYYNMMAVQCIK